MPSATPERFVTPAAAHPVWVKETYEILVETAGAYNRVLTWAELAETIQERTDRWTQAPARSWVGHLLSDIARVCAVRSQPPLTSLVVQADGKVGLPYDEVIELAGKGPVEAAEREQMAAIGRLECYRQWCDDLPVDAAPTLYTRPSRANASGSGTVVRAAAARVKVAEPKVVSSRAAAEERRGAVCPRCFLEMPVAGRCVNCD